MQKGYVMGSLFNEAEVKQRTYEGQVLKGLTGDVIDWYNPIEQPVNDKDKLPTAKDIFAGDTEALRNADYIVGDITNSNDPGVFMELGIAYGLQYARNVLNIIFSDQPDDIKAQLNEAFEQNGLKFKKILAVCSDIRLATADKYKGVYIPYGQNQYVIGGLESMGAMIVDKFDGVATIINQDVHPVE